MEKFGGMKNKSYLCKQYEDEESNIFRWPRGDILYDG